MYDHLLQDPQHREKAKALHQLARVLIACQHDQQALIVLRQTLYIWKITLAAQHPDLMLCKKDIVHLHWRQIQRFVRKRKISHKEN